MTLCKHQFGCHSCDTALKALYDAIKEYLADEDKETNRVILDMRIEAAKKMIEDILNFEEEMR